MKKISFSNTLRCVGQDLSRRDFKIFDICIEGDRYLVRGGYTAPTATFPVAIHYSATDIRQLDLAGPEKRGKLPPPSEEFVNLEQVLRTFGGYLDKIEARLIHLTNSEPKGNGHSFRLEYETQDGDHKVEEHSTATVYDMCVAMYKRRGKMTGTNGLLKRQRG
jgi:hypothetical protein